MAEPLEAPHLPPEVVPVDDEFSRLPPDEQVRRTQAWFDSLRELKPIDVPVSGAELVAESRREMGWD